MSTKTGHENDWDINDDNEWDDWDDAEDNLADTTQSGVALEKRTGNGNNGVSTLTSTELKAEVHFPSDQSQVQDQSLQSKQTSGWGNLFGGVVCSVFNTATELTSTVSHGLDKVMGVPDPAEMARINAVEEAKTQTLEKLQQSNHNNNPQETYLTPSNLTPVFGLSLVNNVTSLGSKVLNTGLDTLEGIGKKTMNILQENDPLLKQKIKKLGLENDKPNLSEILKEAKQENEQLEQSLKELGLEKFKAQFRFDVLFENNCGVVHLEALEILSKESALKIQALKESVSGKALDELTETLNEVQELIELEDLECEPDNEGYDKEELNNNLDRAIEDTELQIKFDEIVNLWSTCSAWLTDDESKDLDAQTVFAKGITTLAETCSYEILKLHKIAELLLVREHHSTANEVDGIVQLCKQFNMHLQTVANSFAAHLTKSKEQNEAEIYINTLFSEMLQARQQIEKAFHLFLPILQIGAI